MMPERRTTRIRSAIAVLAAVCLTALLGAGAVPAITKAAQAPRVQLVHLTVRQYRSAVADLIGSFRPSALVDDHRGLRAVYFKKALYGEKALERVDPRVHFDFGDAVAVPGQADPYQFAMRWEGSVYAADTGQYEFVVHTEHGVQLWVNDPKRPLIDALVKSGSGDEYRASIFLLGGRAYPLRLDFSKGVQGVDDLSRLKKKPPAKATISLEWRPPNRPQEVIPERDLLPAAAPPLYVEPTPFPPDDRSMGFERGTGVSREWETAVTESAIDAAGYVVAHLAEISGVPDGAPDRAAKLQDFCGTFVSRALRRPLSPGIQQLYVARQFQVAKDPESAVKRVVMLTLQSPRFLFVQPAEAKPDPYAVASALALTMWDSIPDAELLKAATAGQLATRDQATKQAERMAADPRAWPKVRDFLLQWLKVAGYPDLTRDPKLYPGFDQAMASDLRTSFEMTLQQLAWGPDSDYRKLMLSDKVYLDGRLAKYYGAALPADALFQPVALDSGARAGVLTHPYLLASFAHTDSTSPIHRGVLLARSVLGRMLNPPPAAFVPTPASLQPGMTTRQRIALQTKPAMCSGCHELINPLGFTLEEFDADGRLRKMDNGKPVDCSGSYRTTDGETERFKGARDLAEFIAGSDEAHNAFVEKLFQYMVKQPVQAYGPAARHEIRSAFIANGLSIRKQVIETAVVAAMDGGRAVKTAATTAPNRPSSVNSRNPASRGGGRKERGKHP